MHWLARPLPDVTQPLSIDGYSQTGSAMNTDVRTSTARLLIELASVAGALHALR